MHDMDIIARLAAVKVMASCWWQCMIDESGTPFAMCSKYVRHAIPRGQHNTITSSHVAVWLLCRRCGPCMALHQQCSARSKQGLAAASALMINHSASYKQHQTSSSRLSSSSWRRPSRVFVVHIASYHSTCVLHCAGRKFVKSFFDLQVGM
jgi:hypothetical protein